LAPSTARNNFLSPTVFEYQSNGTGTTDFSSSIERACSISNALAVKAASVLENSKKYK
jgi:hypothetical protein